MMSTKIPSDCPECSGTLATQGGETTCSDCGLVINEGRIDPGPEWRSFEDEETDRRRTGAPLSRSRHDYGLSTEIGYSGSTRATGRKRRLYARLRRQHKRSHCRSKAERNRRDVFMQIRRLTAALSLPDSVRDQACTLFRSAQEEGIVTGRSLEGFTAATVYAACRVHGVSRIRAEVLEASRASRAELDAAYGAMDRELGLPVEVRNRGSELLESAVESELIGGHNPAGVAAACLYTAARERDAGVTQEQAADVADVSPPTIRVTYQALREAELSG